jgi:hypothetical protein
MKARLAENIAIGLLCVGLVLAGALGKVTVDEGQPYDWLLAAVVGGAFLVSASVFGAAAILARDRS